MNSPTILESVFRHFTEENDTMSCDQYIKFTRGCKLLNKDMKRADICSTFAQCVNTSPDKKMSFEKFKENLSLLSANKTMTRNDIVRKVEDFGKDIFYVHVIRTRTKSYSVITQTVNEIESENSIKSATTSMVSCELFNEN